MSVTGDTNFHTPQLFARLLTEAAIATSTVQFARASLRRRRNKGD